jgi:LacI family transcriptional regulator
MTTLSNSTPKHRRTRPTIRDVAAEARVSLKTVSRVLNGEPSVLPATADKVRAAVSRIGFQRNEAAANLRRLGQSTRIIGLLIEDVANPFYSVLARAVEEVAGDHGHLLLVASSGEDPQRERELLTAFCARRVDGLIVVPAGADHSFLSAEIASGTAVVFVDRPGMAGKVDSVVTANADGARDGVAHLLAGGHRRVAYIGDEASIFTATERYRGYRDALTDAGLSIDTSLVRLGPHDIDAAERAAAELLALADPPTAMFAGNNRLTIGTMRAVHRHGSPVAVVGFDDFELADMLTPPVTVVAQDASALGRTAAELLFRRLAGDRRPAQRVTLGTTLIVRGSGEVGG